MEIPIGELIRTAGAGDASAWEARLTVLDRQLHGIAEREFPRSGGDLTVLSGVIPDFCRLVDLHCLCGFSFAETAGLRGIAERTGSRDWRKARLLLHRTVLES